MAVRLLSGPSQSLERGERDDGFMGGSHNGEGGLISNEKVSKL